MLLKLGVAEDCRLRMLLGADCYLQQTNIHHGLKVEEDFCVSHELQFCSIQHKLKIFSYISKSLAYR